jgi:hypothetical protein
MKHTDALKLSIVVPVAPGDKSWKALLTQLAVLAPEHSWILSVSDTGCELEKDDLEAAMIYHRSLSVVTGAADHADQINRAIVTAQTDWIWVLQADAELSPLSVSRLMDSLLLNPDALHSFESVPFAIRPGKRPGLRSRSSLWSMPFGNHGFAFHRQLWQSVGGFTRDLTYGEDYVFCWRLRQAGFHVIRVPLSVPLNPSKRRQHRSRRLPHRGRGLG